MKLGLGTVQLGEAGYGLSRAAGRLDGESVRALVDLAVRGGVDMLDTAPAYGTAEETLGRLLPPDSPLRIVTKTRVFRRPLGPADRSVVAADLRRSLERLRRERIDGLLVHDADDLLREGGGYIFESLQALKEEGVVAGIGVSIYEERQLEAVFERHAVDLVQVPVNLLDQRLPSRGWLDRLKAREIEVHVRSLFLQGVLLADPDTLPARFEAVRDHLRRCDRQTRERGLSRLQAALAYVDGLDACDVAIVGVDSAAQLDQILGELESLPATDDLDWSPYRLDDPDFVDPRRWS